MAVRKKTKAKGGRKPAIQPSPGLIKIRKTKGLSIKLAKRLGISRQAVSDWEVIPLNRMVEVEEFTGIDRSKLRPELFARIRRKARR